MDQNILNVIGEFIGIYSIILIIIATIGNFISTLVCTRKSLRKIPTFVFIGFALISDIVSLYFWNINHFLFAFANYLIEDLGVGYCRFATVLQTTSLQWSASLLVQVFFTRFKKKNCFNHFLFSFKTFMSIDRYLSVKIKKMESSIFQI